ncbi:SIR2 family protein [Fodinicurvata fenggangensis]|uniref:SIR2 family protein n=1 Tax=Fodinicurvata fenggangensis TaxID=1121830 RepID=UPI0004787AAD|nr:SIR2 family protein [Fodinicurvata fenggangensis]
MQLIPEGPNIPEALLNAHADGTVVFFCGAGVSLDAGYPLFGGLVKELAKRNPITCTPELNEAITREDYDFALSIIQKRLAKNAIKLRHDTASILSRRPKTLKNHTAILRLSHLRDDTCRLITTNFDRLFLKAAKKQSSINIDSAPKLPIPKSDRWSSVLHLHGLLPAKPNDLELGNLILTSADFGEAYVTDGYCSRFVVELLRNFTVVFIGYSLNDRIMRYLLDAISYSEKFFDDSEKNGKFNKPYAFVEHNENNKEQVIGRWELKEVIPIPYFVEEKRLSNRGSHFRLYETLNSWADLASGGQNARVTLALNEATKPFLAEDTFGQERLLWALRDGDGKAAKALATVEKKEQTASIDWLPFFAQHGLLDQIYSPTELRDLRAQQQRDTVKVEPGYLGSVTNGSGVSRLKPVTANLIRWMQWHLDTVDLVNWVLENGAVTHPEFSLEYNRPQRAPKQTSLSKDQTRLWNILTSDAYARSHLPASHWFDSRENLDFRDPFDALEFLAHIEQKLIIRPSIFRDSQGHSETYFEQFEFELKFRNHEMDYQVGQIVNNPTLHKGLESLCEQLGQVVLSGLDWLSLVDKASNEQDLTGYSIPSISPHTQNDFVNDFGQLVFLLRVAFDRRLSAETEGAIKIAHHWAQQDYPLFKRLFLYASNQVGAALDHAVLDLLVNDDGRWLWAMDTTHEVNVYLREQVKHWKQSEISRLCRTILKGPNRSSYREMPNKEWRNIRDQTIAHYLKKLEQGGVQLPRRTSSSLAKLKTKFPHTLPEDGSDEFMIFIGTDREMGRDEGMESAALHEFMQMTVTKRVAQWKPDQSRILQKLAFSNPSAALDTLEEGLTKNLGDECFWSEGISGLARAIEVEEPNANAAASEVDGEAPNTRIPLEHLERMLPILAKLPEESLQSRKVANAIVEFWRKSPVISLTKDRYLKIWDRIWAASAKDPSQERDINDPVGYAINDPAGKLTEELLKYLWPKDAKVGGGIPQELADRLKKIVERTNHSAIDASSIIVVSRTEILHAVAPEFAKQNILPLLKWESNSNAASYWSAFLWPARISPDLFKLIETDCLTALSKPDRFEARAYKTLCQMFLLASMELNATSKETIKTTLAEIGTKGLENISSFIRDRVRNAKEDAPTYWKKTVLPWLSEYWPRDYMAQTKKTMEDFAMVAVYSGTSFPNTLSWLEDNGLIGEIPTASTILFSLKKRTEHTHEDFKDSSTLPEQFPSEVLHLLWLTRPFQWDHGYAKQILARLTEANPALFQTEEYLSISENLS